MNKTDSYFLFKGILLQRGFAFLQFMAKDSAEQAIEKENKTMLKEKLIAVRAALVKPEGSTNPGAQILLNNAHQGPNINNRPQQQQKPQPIVNSSGFMRNTDSNDVEIIVHSKDLTPYAEYIEGQLTRIGIKVDVLYPNIEVPMGKILANIASRKTLYAILVTPTNMSHQSVTVNILYGTPAEHRNMPVDAAFDLIEKDWKRYMAQENQSTPVIKTNQIPISVPIAPVIASMAPISTLTDRHPDVIQNLMYLIVDNKPLTALQYDRIIQYLSDRREQQVRMELGDEAVAALPKTVTSTLPKIDEAELEVQKKINDILSTPDLLESIEKNRGVFKMTKETLELLRDPRVERAIDSLLTKEVFSTLGLS